ncbi:hypothetical protein J6590_035530 [Homalodisca vitripennis]|nr:hypothetical protein J6590_035530 [Homalodisca vitripennis]
MAAAAPEDPEGTTECQLSSLSSIAEQIPPPEEEGKLFFDLDQGDLVDTSNRAVLFELCSEQEQMIPKNCQELEEEGRQVMFQEESPVSPKTYYNSFTAMDIKPEWPKKAGLQERTLAELLRDHHQEYSRAWKGQVRPPGDRIEIYPSVRRDVQIKQGDEGGRLKPLESRSGACHLQGVISNTFPQSCRQGGGLGAEVV